MEGKRPLETSGREGKRPLETRLPEAKRRSLETTQLAADCSYREEEEGWGQQVWQQNLFGEDFAVLATVVESTGGLAAWGMETKAII